MMIDYFGMNLNLGQFSISEEIPIKKVDLAICSHLLLHIQPEKIISTIENMIESSRQHIIFIEPIPGRVPKPWAYYNFEHDYPEIITTLGYKFKMVEVEANIGLYHIEKY